MTPAEMHAHRATSAQKQGDAALAATHAEAAEAAAKITRDADDFWWARAAWIEARLAAPRGSELKKTARRGENRMNSAQDRALDREIA